MNEADLITGCIKRDPSCQKELFLRYSGKMMTVCKRYSKNSADAEDIMQDGFIRLFQHLHQYKSKGSFEGWMRKIFVNCALKKYTVKRFEKEQTGIDHIGPIAMDPGIIDTLSEKELINLIQKLPEGYRIVFNMYVIEGFSHKEIAEKLEINEATSRTQLLKARKQLQRKIAKMQSIIL